MSKKLIFFGNGSNIKAIYNMVSQEGIDVHGFCVDDEYHTSSTFLDKPIYKFSDFVNNCPPNDYELFSPMGPKHKCQSRKRVYEQFKSLKYDFLTFIHRSAILYTDRKNIGENVFIGALAACHPDIIISDNCYIGEGVLIAHDTIIGKHSYIGAGSIIGGGCNIGEEVSLGLRSTIRSQTSIASKTCIGMGVSIHRNIEKASTHIFSPLEQKWFC
tara:strand:- start:15210 stop:15854 length:645 start_codon:yes stop_codon:yes gene_type:complete